MLPDCQASNFEVGVSVLPDCQASNFEVSVPVLPDCQASNFEVGASVLPDCQVSDFRSWCLSGSSVVDRCEVICRGSVFSFLVVYLPSFRLNSSAREVCGQTLWPAGE